jgi:glycosyltransferase involved in cell wall biosynthesis
MTMPRAPKKVLYLITSDVSARFLRGQLAYLIERGYEVHVGVGRSGRSAPFDDGVVVHGLPYEREPHPVNDGRALWQTIRLVRSVRPDIVNASTPKAGLLGMLAARLLRIPRRIHVVRGLRYETMTGRKRTVMAWLEGLSMRLATVVVFNSASLREIAESDCLIDPGRGELLGGGSGNGIDVDRFHGRFSRDEVAKELGADPARQTIGFIGRLTADKGVPDLIEAFDLVRREVPAAQLVVIGDYEEGSPVPATVRARIAEDPDIVHVPWTDEPERVYAAFDVVAFPSYREGLPNVVLEAGASGVPVVGYDASGTRDAVSHEARRSLIPASDVAGLATGLCDALHLDSAQRTTLVTREREWVRTTFAQEQIWSDLEAIYRR